MPWFYMFLSLQCSGLFQLSAVCHAFVQQGSVQCAVCTKVWQFTWHCVHSLVSTAEKFHQRSVECLPVSFCDTLSLRLRRELWGKVLVILGSFHKKANTPVAHQTFPQWTVADKTTDITHSKDRDVAINHDITHSKCWNELRYHTIKWQERHKWTVADKTTDITHSKLLTKDKGIAIN